MFTFIKEHDILSYSFLCGVCAFLMAFLRTGGFTTRNLSARLTEMCMCSMISGTSGVFLLRYFSVPVEILLPIGTAIGYLGTDFYKSLIKSIIESKINSKVNNNER